MGEDPEAHNNEFEKKKKRRGKGVREWASKTRGGETRTSADDSSAIRETKTGEQ